MPDTGLRPDAPLPAIAPAGEVVVIGLGYVGRPLALEAAAAGFLVTGFDLCAAAGRTAEAAWQATGRRGGRLRSTSDPAALPPAATWLVCVPTPLDAAGRPDLSAVAAAFATCRARMPRGALACLVSTCQPGATNGLCRAALEQDGWRVGRDVFLAVSPERENPGDAQGGPRRIARLLGAPDPASLAQARAFWDRVTDTVVPVATPEIAECAKLLENSYRLVNVALMDQLHAAFAALGVPTRDVVAAAATKPFGFAPFWPGLGAGGHCIPVDPAFLQMEARRAGAPSRLLDLALAANEARPGRVAAAIADAFGGSIEGRRILVAGVTYKPDVADLRGAAPVALLHGLRGAGAEALWCDPLIGDPPPDLAEIPRVAHPADAAPDALVLGTPHRAFDLAALARAAPLVFDPFGLLPADAEGRVRAV
ncbi:nucleotide sugar dehydrogenase [Roseomonas sp. CECT 9278]|uniref:nucleotide sugar dehydrogenase n=1 Tax=Roseomonas sp. CECT 9278 TaxID=2845823 RepID=UPI001E566122|nr:nucleotide sugar dehydrogenase [Roseomonas sp. CECT 9278]CAH0310571.1 UDP-N-acetyl-D-glucosamine 6-dehydrogenase [Roseomonas sp. CECT 9278]